MYVYIAILRLITRYPKYFPRDRAVEFGHKKMRYITEGINAIDRKIEDEKLREKKKIEIFNRINPQMASTEIDAFIENIVEEI